ncbi:hypothetical protein AB0N16_38445 [Streptomyces sp. NPDC051105]|uniref:hypothetical protein n=1 Tax=Streptomyces sp. NPDC051105 TaxID=3154843 RepID=UPI003421F072
MLLVDARFGDEPVPWCPYIYVDNDLALARGWRLPRLDVVHRHRSASAERVGEQDRERPRPPQRKEADAHHRWCAPPTRRSSRPPPC